MRKTVAFIFSLAVFSKLFSQGCSDAGFCTIGSGSPSISDTAIIFKNKVSMILTNGIGDDGVYVFTPALQHEFQVNKSLSIQSRVTGNYADGNLGAVFAPGDFYLSGVSYFPKRNRISQAATFGMKVPLNSSNIEVSGKGLPMQYQSSLGTLDLILLYKLQIKKLSIDAGWQQPLTGNNKNTFLPSIWNTEDAAKYPPSYNLNRKGDVLVRLGYNLIEVTNFHWNVSFLGIYHLAEDEYSDLTNSGLTVQLIGSKGLTLNLTTAIQYTFNKKYSINLTAGTPLIVREIRPDGLTRAFVISPQFNYHF